MTTETRTYEWDARVPDLAAARGMDGLTYLQEILAGRAPGAPISSTIDIWPVEVARGFAAFEGTPRRYVYNPMGAVHGGWSATLLDSAMGCAVMSTLPAGSGYTTVELSVRLVKGLTEATGTVRCEGRAVHVGGSIVTAEGRIVDAAGTLYAHGATTCLVLGKR